MKYSKVDWSKYIHGAPSEEVFNDWVAMRKAKRAATTQTAINGTAKHVNALNAFGYTSDDCFSIACENGWQGMKWVHDNERKTGFQNGSLQVALCDNVQPIRSTRDIPLHESLTDRSWAD